MISNNIGQIAYLNAKLHQCSRIFFCGGFVQDNPYVWARLTYAIHFWSKSEMEALFLSHDGYLGALGALLAES
jgi:pantothenate kinase